MNIIEYLKVILLGIVEGITEWLPISSTGHMMLVEYFIKLNMSEEFKTMFFVLIQLGAILAVIILYFNKIMPFDLSANFAIKKDVMQLWYKILVACVPAGVIGILFDDELDRIFYNAPTIVFTLIFYGVIMIWIENRNKGLKPRIRSLDKITYRVALLIGIFQLLALIPGTSRSGATIIGAILIGASRTIAAEFTFFLAIPVMFGASFVKLIKFGFDFTGTEISMLILGMVVAFVVSILAIKFLMQYIKKNDFKAFGWYRIILGSIILVILLLQ